MKEKKSVGATVRRSDSSSENTGHSSALLLHLEEEMRMAMKFRRRAVRKEVRCVE